MVSEKPGLWFLILPFSRYCMGVRKEDRLLSRSFSPALQVAVQDSMALVIYAHHQRHCHHDWDI